MSAVSEKYLSFDVDFPLIGLAEGRFAALFMKTAPLAGLSVGEVGTMLLAGQLLISRAGEENLRPSISKLELARALKMRGVVSLDAILSDFKQLGLVEIIGEEIQIPLVNQAIQEILPERALKKIKNPAKVVNGAFILRLNLQDESEISLCIQLKSGLEGRVTKAYINNIKIMFPNIDVDMQLLHLCSWCTANETRRKTPAGLPRFLNSWLMSASEKAMLRQAILQTAPIGNGFGQSNQAMPAPASVFGSTSGQGGPGLQQGLAADAKEDFGLNMVSGPNTQVQRQESAPTISASTLQRRFEERSTRLRQH